MDHDLSLKAIKKIMRKWGFVCMVCMRGLQKSKSKKVFLGNVMCVCMSSFLVVFR